MFQDIYCLLYILFWQSCWVTCNLERYCQPFNDWCQLKGHTYWRILTGKKHPKIKLQRLQKIRIWTFGSLAQQINSLYEVLKLEQIFEKNKVVTGKTLLFLIGPFCSRHSVVLTLAYDRAVFNGNGVFSILVVSTKKTVLQFFEKDFRLPEIFFES